MNSESSLKLTLEIVLLALITHSVSSAVCNPHSCGWLKCQEHTTMSTGYTGNYQVGYIPFEVVPSSLEVRESEALVEFPGFGAVQLGNSIARFWPSCGGNIVDWSKKSCFNIHLTAQEANLQTFSIKTLNASIPAEITSDRVMTVNGIPLGSYSQLVEVTPSPPCNEGMFQICTSRLDIKITGQAGSGFTFEYLRETEAGCQKQNSTDGYDKDGFVRPGWTAIGIYRNVEVRYPAGTKPQEGFKITQWNKPSGTHIIATQLFGDSFIEELTENYGTTGAWMISWLALSGILIILVLCLLLWTLLAQTFSIAYKISEFILMVLDYLSLAVWSIVWLVIWGLISLLIFATDSQIKFEKGKINEFKKTRIVLMILFFIVVNASVANAESNTITPILNICDCPVKAGWTPTDVRTNCRQLALDAESLRYFWVDPPITSYGNLNVTYDPKRPERGFVARKEMVFIVLILLIATVTFSMMSVKASLHLLERDVKKWTNFKTRMRTLSWVPLAVSLFVFSISATQCAAQLPWVCARTVDGNQDCHGLPGVPVTLAYEGGNTSITFQEEHVFYSNNQRPDIGITTDNIFYYSEEGQTKCDFYEYLTSIDKNYKLSSTNGLDAVESGDMKSAAMDAVGAIGAAQFFGMKAESPVLVETTTANCMRIDEPTPVLIAPMMGPFRTCKFRLGGRYIRLREGEQFAFKNFIIRCNPIDKQNIVLASNGTVASTYTTPLLGELLIGIKYHGAAINHLLGRAPLGMVSTGPGLRTFATFNADERKIQPGGSSTGSGIAHALKFDQGHGLIASCLEIAKFQLSSDDECLKTCWQPWKVGEFMTIPFWNSMNAHRRTPDMGTEKSFSPPVCIVDSNSGEKATLDRLCEAEKSHQDVCDPLASLCDNPFEFADYSPIQGSEACTSLGSRGLSLRTCMNSNVTYSATCSNVAAVHPVHITVMKTPPKPAGSTQRRDFHVQSIVGHIIPSQKRVCPMKTSDFTLKRRGETAILDYTGGGCSQCSPLYVACSGAMAVGIDVPCITGAYALGAITEENVTCHYRNGDASMTTNHKMSAAKEFDSGNVKASDKHTTRPGQRIITGEESQDCEGLLNLVYCALDTPLNAITHAVGGSACESYLTGSFTDLGDIPSGFGATLRCMMGKALQMILRIVLPILGIGLFILIVLGILWLISRATGLTVYAWFTERTKAEPAKEIEEQGVLTDVPAANHEEKLEEKQD